VKGPKKLRIDALRSDLAAVMQMVARSREFNDAIGEHQFAQRKESIEAQLRELTAIDEHIGSVALFFGGSPVIGSRGVEADFAGEALSAFQELVKKRLVVEEIGGIAARGPVANRAASQLLITDVARGSFGFLLEEAAAGDALADTELRVVIDQTSHLIADVASPDDGVFEDAMSNIDARTLISLKKFFDVLDTGRATIRLVEDDKEFNLQRPDVARARSRVDVMEVAEEEATDIVGVLYLLPQHKTFELIRDDTGETIYGKVEPGVIRRLVVAPAGGEPFVGRKWRTVMKIRKVRQRGREEKVFYKLADLIEV
jgi:hypothetical protein